jgi:hypothetical protein
MHAFNEHLPHPVILPAASRDTFNVREVDFQTCENHHVALMGVMLKQCNRWTIAV